MDVPPTPRGPHGRPLNGPLPLVVQDVASRGIADGAFPGVAIAATVSGAWVVPPSAFGHAYLYRDGRRTLAAQPVQCTPDVRFDLASLTKVLVAALAARLAFLREVRLDAPIRDVLPWLHASTADVTLRHLLTHTSGLPARLSSPATVDSSGLLGALGRLPVEAAPGVRHCYTDLGYLVAGLYVERVLAEPLDRLVDTVVTGPLGLGSVVFRPPAATRSLTAATEFVEGRGLVYGEVHDWKAWLLGGVAGHAGLFGTVGDVACLGMACLERSGPFGDGVLETMITPAVVEEEGRGLGFLLHARRFMGELADGGFGHTGFTGCSLVVNLPKRVVAVMLTNRVHPRRDGPSLHPLRQALANWLARGEAEE